MTFSLFLSKFWKSRNFGDFGHFSTNFACGTHFQEVPERELGVFQANVAIWPDKTCILTGSTQNPFGQLLECQHRKLVRYMPRIRLSIQKIDLFCSGVNVKAQGAIIWCLSFELAKILMVRAQELLLTPSELGDTGLRSWLLTQKLDFIWNPIQNTKGFT